MSNSSRSLGIVLAILFVASCATERSSPKAWNGVGEGMTRAEMVAKLGEPTSSTAAVDTWRLDGWELRSEYDHEGRATQVDRLLILR